MATVKITIVGINYVPERTGIAPYATGLSTSLAAAGDRVRVITGYPHYPQWLIYDGYTGHTRHEILDGVHISRVRQYVPRHPRLVNRFLMELTFGMRAILLPWGASEAIVTVTPALFSSRLALFKARFSRAKRIAWVQDIYSLGIAETGMGGGLAGRLLRRIERSTLRSADLVVVIHERFKRYLIDELEIDTDSIAVIRNWSHIPDIDGAQRSTTRAKYGWDAEDVIVLHAGNMGTKQGLENVVAASELAASRNSRVRFVMLGDGSRRAALEALGTNSCLQYLDPLPDEEFRATLGASDILLVNERPGLKEMCVPSKLTSYFSTGLPVIAATDAESITAEEMDAAGAGRRVPAGDPGALLAVAEELAADPALCTELGEAGRVFKHDHLSAAAAVEHFRELLV